MQNSETFQLHLKLGGEICSSDVNMHKGHWAFVSSRFRFNFIFILPSLLRWAVYVKKNRSFTMGLLPLNAAPRDNLFELCSSNFDEEGNKGLEHILTEVLLFTPVHIYSPFVWKYFS